MTSFNFTNAPLFEEKAKERSLDFLHYRLTTAEILYHMPDHPSVLQSFVWQQMDLIPKYPALHKFLKFWEHNIDGRLHSVRVAHQDAPMPSTYRFADGMMTLH